MSSRIPRLAPKLTQKRGLGLGFMVYGLGFRGCSAEEFCCLWLTWAHTIGFCRVESVVALFIHKEGKLKNKCF